jgi:DNA-binding response OmpR family regulator
MRILLVEDDSRIARFVAKGLREQAYAVDLAENGEEALYQSSVNSYDLIILDVMIPAPDGFEVCRRLRESGSRIPILILTARDATDDRVRGLNMGADDYMTKPFEFRELLARLRALLRRSGELRSDRIAVDDLVLDTATQTAVRAGKQIALTTKEYALLEYLARNAGRIVGREEISEHVWDETFDPFTNTIEVYVNRLRRKIDESAAKPLIQTRRGAGYMIGAVRASGPAAAHNGATDGAKTKPLAIKSAAEPRAAGKRHA